MTLRILAAAATVTLAMPAFAEVTGVWRSAVNTIGDSIDMQVVPCGRALCGASGPSAEDGAFSARMALKGDNTLSLSGCVLGGGMRRSEDFQRVN